MKTAALWKITVATTTESEEAVSELLLSLFAQPVSSYTDVETGLALVSAYLERAPAGYRTAIQRGLQRVRAAGLHLGPAAISARRLPRRDWAESWKRHFKPITIGSKLLIKPSWSLRRPAPGQACMILDPGLSFGTGHHPTTAFCLEQIVARRTPARRQSFLDIGTGSGILAIAAARLGYRPVDAIDFDPDAVRVAAANGRRNRVQDRMRVRRADVRRIPKRAGRRYDLVCANLISTLLISECERIVGLLNPGGLLVLAGILKTEFANVEQVYCRAGLIPSASRTKNEWCSGAFLLRATG